MNYLYTAIILGAVFIILGAFGAHVLVDMVSADRLIIFEKAVFYHIVHTVLIVILELQSKSQFIWSKRLFLSGILIFSGSLYLLVLTNTSWLGKVTPIGGLCFILGWLFIGIESRNNVKHT